MLIHPFTEVYIYNHYPCFSHATIVKYTHTETLTTALRCSQLYIDLLAKTDYQTAEGWDGRQTNHSSHSAPRVSDILEPDGHRI